MLTELWKSKPKELEDKRIDQIIGFAGSGKLLDDSPASNEFRAFLSQIPSQLLGRYAEECLEVKFEDKGLALQDIVNEVGVRLDFKVERGRYRGSSTGEGYDGVWHFPNEPGAIVIEVKTSSTFPISVETLAGYRREVHTSTGLPESAITVLIAVGGGDTRDREAQIRGSRYAWDIRLISIGALFRLLKLKEEAEDPTVVHRIQSILLPREFTRLDDLIEVAFAAAEDVRLEDSEEEAGQEAVAKRAKRPRFVPVSFHEECIKKIQSHLNQPLIKQSRSIYKSPDSLLMVSCMVSREHGAEGEGAYWFAFHPHQKEILQKASVGYVGLGCGSARRIFLIPISDLVTWLDGLNTTTREDRSYWHISIFEDNGAFNLHRKKGFERIDLGKYLLKQ